MDRPFVIRNATIVDGTGSPAYPGMIVLDADKIAYAGPQISGFASHEVMDARNMIVCPGFIDMHGHSDLQVFRSPLMEAKITQGITTEVIGNCGMGVYPLVGDKKKLLARISSDILGESDGRWPWSDFDSYARCMESCGCGTNVVGMQAHAPLRYAAMGGSTDRSASGREIAHMVDLLRQAFETGAAGFSTGLYYAPCLFASKEELLALLRETARQDRLFAVHHRCEGDGVADSLREVLDLALTCGVRIEISHLKAIGHRNQRHVSEMLGMLESYANRGLRVGFDQYPYIFGSTSLYSLLPPRCLGLSRAELARLLGDKSERRLVRIEMESPRGWDSIVSLCAWEDIRIMHVDGNPEFSGKSLAHLAQELSTDPCDLLFDILEKMPGTAVMTDVTQSEESLKLIMSHPLGCFGTDALYSGPITHPRSTQAVMHVLAKYWKACEVLPLEKHIRRMCSVTGERLGLKDRGILRRGYHADLVLLDPDALTDGPAGSAAFFAVIVNGVLSCERGRPTGRLAGRVLRS